MELSLSVAGHSRVGVSLVRILLGVLCQFLFGLAFVLFGCCIFLGIYVF